MRWIAIYIYLVAFLFAGEVKAQHLPEHINNEGIYEFLDEMANEGWITLSSVVRPYSHERIAAKLDYLSGLSFRLTKRQRHLLDVYRMHYIPRQPQHFREGLRLLSGEVSLAPPAYQYLTRDVNLTLRPITEGHYHHNSQDAITHLHYGLGFSAQAGGSWAGWASLEQVRQWGEVLDRPEFLVRHEGGTWAHEDIPEGEDYHQYNQLRGGFSYSWGWGSVGFQKEHLTWGDHYHAPNILDLRHNTPSYPMIAMEIRTGNRFSFHYHHGWLNSMLIRDTITFDPPHPDRYEYHNKYFAGNMFTVMPLDGLHLSAGNSIIYSASNMYIGNFIPIMIFRAMEPAQAESDGLLNNTMAFFNVSSRQIRHLHLYASWFTNSFKFSRLGDSGRTNYNSTKLGGRLNNWPVPDTDLTVEYTFTMPKTFEHRTPIITYAHKNFNMGHYLGPNANDLYASIGMKPWRGLSLRICYNQAKKGNLYPHAYAGAQDRDPYMEKVAWQSRSLSLEAQYTLYNNIGLFARVRHRNVEGFDLDDHNDYSAQDYLDMFSPNFHHGETTTFSFGFYMR